MTRDYPREPEYPPCCDDCELDCYEPTDCDRYNEAVRKQETEDKAVADSMYQHYLETKEE